MIKGALESVSEDSVSGWLYSPELEMKGRLVLAFQGAKCIGSGEINAFRQDLLNAGLGDGFLGFEFPITRIKGAEDAVVIKLDQGDLILAQAGLLAADSQKKRRRKLSAEEITDKLSSLKWELGRGTILQSDYDFLRSLLQQGVFEKSLFTKVVAGQQPEIGDVNKELDVHFSVFARRDVKVTVAKLDSTEQLAQLLASVSSSEIPLLALQASAPTSVKIREGSHSVSGVPVQGHDRFTLQPQTLIFIDPRVDLAIAEQAFSQAEILGYHASRA